MNADRVEIFQDKSHEWRWRKRAANGRIVADSGESYLHHRDALAMAVQLFPGLPVVELAFKHPPVEREPDPVEPQDS